MDFNANTASSLPRIPQSAQRSQEQVLQKSPLFSSIQATPTRKAATGFPQASRGSLGVPDADYGGFPPSSPLHVRGSSAQLFPVVPESSKKPSGSLPREIQETPKKERSLPRSEHGHPEAPDSGDKENAQVKLEVSNERLGKSDSRREESIYKSLGWDDADDTDDLA